MDRSDAWCWSPEIGFGPKRITWPMFDTFDSFKPSGAAAPAKLKGWADVDLDEVKSKLQAVVAEARFSTIPPRPLKHIAELQRQLKATPAPSDIDAQQWQMDVKQSHAEGFKEDSRASSISSKCPYYGSLESWSKECWPPVIQNCGRVISRPPALLHSPAAARARQRPWAPGGDRGEGKTERPRRRQLISRRARSPCCQPASNTRMGCGASRPLVLNGI